MIYEAYQSFSDVSSPVRTFATNFGDHLKLWDPSSNSTSFHRLSAYYELIALSGYTHTRPDYGINYIKGKDGDIPITETLVHEGTFCDLLKFSKTDSPPLPKILLIAPMSGHFATLLRGTIRTLLQDYEVHVTDWRNIRDIPLDAGVFGLDEFVEHIMTYIRMIGPATHVVAVCQPTVPALAAVALMAEDKDPMQPASLTLMAGPVDTRVSPTKVNDLANEHPIEWFRDNLIGVIPQRLGGAGRKVYPGFLQLTAFMSMNTQRHAKSFADLFKYRVEGEFDKADAIKHFYEEYFAIMDLSADFYLETIDVVFQKASLAAGTMTYKNRLVDPSAIKKTFLLTVEGEKDDICAVGQTLAAQDLCSGLRPYMKTHHMQPGVGHYGVFNGRKWDNQIYPIVRNHIQASL